MPVPAPGVLRHLRAGREDARSDEGRHRPVLLARPTGGPFCSHRAGRRVLLRRHSSRGLPYGLAINRLAHGDRIAPRAIVQQHKTGRPVQSRSRHRRARPRRPGSRKHAEERGLPLPEPHQQLAAHLRAAVRAHAARLAQGHRPGLDRVRHASMRRTKRLLSGHQCGGTSLWLRRVDTSRDLAKRVLLQPLGSVPVTARDV